MYYKLVFGICTVSSVLEPAPIMGLFSFTNNNLTSYIRGVERNTSNWKRNNKKKNFLKSKFFFSNVDDIDIGTQLAPPIWNAKLVIFLETDRQLRSWKILENNVKFSSKMVSILRKIFSICTETLICTFNYQN